MKLFMSILLVVVFAMLNTGCISRTTTNEKCYGKDRTETKTIWVWQKDFRKPK